jgi:hypothetical protein
MQRPDSTASADAASRNIAARRPYRHYAARDHRPGSRRHLGRPGEPDREQLRPRMRSYQSTPGAHRVVRSRQVPTGARHERLDTARCRLSDQPPCVTVTNIVDSSSRRMRGMAPMGISSSIRVERLNRPDLRRRRPGWSRHTWLGDPWQPHRQSACGSRDQNLEELLENSGLRVSAITFDELASRATSAPQPTLVISTCATSHRSRRPRPSCAASIPRPAS